MVQFKDKTLLITGGGTGIGEAIAYQFAQRGTNVILSGLGEEQLKKVEERCRRYGVKAWHKELNLESRESIDALVEYVDSLGLKPDFFVLNAGISQRALTLDCDISMDRKLMEINYFGGVYLIKKYKDHLKSAKDIHIAVTTSISGLFGFPLRLGLLMRPACPLRVLRVARAGIPQYQSDFSDTRPHQDRDIQKRAAGLRGEVCENGSGTGQRHGRHEVRKSGPEGHIEGKAQEADRWQGAADGIFLQIYPMAFLTTGQEGVRSLIMEI